MEIALRSAAGSTEVEMPDFSDNLKPASPTGPEILSKERGQSDVPIDELSQHLLSRNDFLSRQKRVLPIVEKDPLFKKVKQLNLSRPERYQLGEYSRLEPLPPETF